MVAVPLAGDERLIVVGAPAYFVRDPKPVHPRDLAGHERLNWRPTADAPGYRWEFTEDGRDFSVAVPTRVLTNEVALLLRLARAGRGLTMLYERELRDDLARGELVVVLDEFSTPFPGGYQVLPLLSRTPAGLAAAARTGRPRSPYADDGAPRSLSGAHDRSTPLDSHYRSR